MGALDTTDHNPSATTAQGSFHGTGISIFQFLTVSNTGIIREPVVIEPISSCKISLPDDYCNVPAVSCKIESLGVSEYTCAQGLSSGKADEAGWVEHGMQLLAKEKLGSEDYVSWAAFHASAVASDDIDPPALIALLPLFYEKAATLSMVKHGMDIQRQITNHLNPGQIPDYKVCPGESNGKNHIVVTFGGLHIEMALGNTLGDFLDGSGWTTAISEAQVASSGTTDSFLEGFPHLQNPTYM